MKLHHGIQGKLLLDSVMQFVPNNNKHNKKGQRTADGAGEETRKRRCLCAPVSSANTHLGSRAAEPAKISKKRGRVKEQKNASEKSERRRFSELRSRQRPLLAGGVLSCAPVTRSPSARRGWRSGQERVPTPQKSADAPSPV